MKCPKCGYNSFEFHHVCKKCFSDLTGYKVTYGLKEIVFTQEARSSMAVALMAETAVGNQALEPVADVATDMFTFDLPDENTSIMAATVSDNLFDFGEESFTTELPGFGEFPIDDNQKLAQAKADEDAFADLLESSSHNGDTAVAPAPIPVEFDLNNFSWDETPATSAATEAKPEEDFNSLFGELDNATKK